MKQELLWHVVPHLLAYILLGCGNYWVEFSVHNEALRGSQLVLQNILHSHIST